MADKINKIEQTFPKFRTEGTRDKPRVFLQCSNCEKDIREIGMTDQIAVDRAYYCNDCDPKVVVLNTPSGRAN